MNTVTGVHPNPTRPVRVLLPRSNLKKLGLRNGQLTVRIVTWNVEWAEPRTARGQIVLEIFQSLNADVIVLTEGCVDLLPTGGFTIDGGRDWGYDVKDPRRRKVIMWSRNMWTSERTGSESMPPGRFVSGTTETSIGDLALFGVCIPWRDAHVRTGQKNRTAWEDHLTFLRHLGPLIESSRQPLIVAGDFNQRIPRSRAPRHVYESLNSTFRNLVIPTDCVPDDPLIDHVAHTSGLQTTSVEIIPASKDGHRLTDHRGVVVDIIDGRDDSNARYDLPA